MASRIHAALLSAILIFAAPCAGASAATGSPSEVVEHLNAVLLDVMRNAKELGYQGRYERLAPVLREAFNFPLMAGVSVGKHWRMLNEKQRAQLIESFARMSIGTFASRFDGYKGEHFELVGEQQGPRKSVLVRNRLIKSDGETVEINYLLKTYDDRWRVVDVYLDAKYSELAMKRSEYTSVVANEGFDSLIRRIDDKLAQFAAKG
ncbi:MAG: ABC transporter substrate-binding protein [Kiloniellaceae bacterium]